jgi:hypothetical protein
LFVLVTTLAFAQSRSADDESKNPAAKPANKLLGTWKRISGKYNGEVSPLPEGTTQVKHVTPTHFIWAVYGHDGKVSDALGGTYTLKGDGYVETPQYGVGDLLELKGKPQEFKWKVEGNKWYHTGKVSIGDGVTVEEVWERVENK